MPRSIHSTFHDQGVSHDLSEPESAFARKPSLSDRDPSAVRRLCWALAGIAMTIGLLIFVATFAPAERAASHASGATPAGADEVMSEVRRDDTGYFPAQFVVEPVDASPCSGGPDGGMDATGNQCAE
jgi:hypothetical protein